MLFRSVDYLQAGDVLVFNDVKVIKAKLEAIFVKNGKKTTMTIGLIAKIVMK